MQSVTVSPSSIDFSSDAGISNYLKLSAAPSALHLSGVANASVRLSGIADPTTAADAVNQDWAIRRSPVRPAVKYVARVGPCAAHAGDMVDGNALEVGDRILRIAETSAVHNGIFVVSNSGSGEPVRTTDLPDLSNAMGCVVFVADGQTARGMGFICISAIGADVVGQHALFWTPLVAASAAVLDDTDSSSVSTGAITTAGGVGIAQTLNVGGSIHCGNTVHATGFYTLSDARWKHDIVPIDDAINAISKLQPVSFAYRGGSDYTAGFVAQDLPREFSGAIDSRDPERLNVNYQHFTPYLTRAIQQIHETLTIMQNDIQKFQSVLPV